MSVGDAHECLSMDVGWARFCAHAICLPRGQTITLSAHPTRLADTRYGAAPKSWAVEKRLFSDQLYKPLLFCAFNMASKGRSDCSRPPGAMLPVMRSRPSPCACHSPWAVTSTSPRSVSTRSSAVEMRCGCLGHAQFHFYGHRPNDSTPFIVIPSLVPRHL